MSKIKVRAVTSVVRSKPGEVERMWGIAFTHVIGANDFGEEAHFLEAECDEGIVSGLIAAKKVMRVKDDAPPEVVPPATKDASTAKRGRKAQETAPDQNVLDNEEEV